MSSARRRRLRAMAHALEPLVRIGRAGLSTGVVEAADQALLDHELIKVRFQEFKAQRHEMAGLLARRLEAELVGLVGHVAILYRPHPDPDRRRIQP